MHLIFRAIAFALLFITTTVNADDPEISIKGLTKNLQNNVQAFLSLTQESCQSPHWRIRNLFTKSNSEINKALRALGYYHPKIIKNLIFTDACWHASFDISVSEPVRVRTLVVKIQGEAEQQPAFQKLLANLPVKQGDILNHALYEKIKQDLHSLALEYGYLKKRLIKKSLRVEPNKKRADIVLILNSGPRHHFGKITIDQNILNPDFVQRFFTIKPDHAYSRKEMAKTHNKLSDSIYFDSVDIKPQMANIKNNKVPLHISLTAKEKHDYNIGIGFDTDIGPLASIGYQNHRLNKKGHYLSINADISPILSSTEASYMIPFSQPRNDHVALAIGYKHEQPDSFKSEEAKLSLQYQHVFQNGWKQVAFFDISYENFTISEETRTTTLLVPGVRWEYKASDHPLRPSQGYKLNFSLLSAPESITSDVSFIQTTAAGKLISSLPWSAQLISRISLGATLTDNFERLPTAYRFYAGGTETIRGYEYKELGPRDDQAEVVGGKMLTLASLEYEQFINETWGMATFFDAGNAYNVNNIEIKTGVGVGVRWFSPIGPIRLDFALPLSESDSSFQIHFSAGSIL